MVLMNWIHKNVSLVVIVVSWITIFFSSFLQEPMWLVMRTIESELHVTSEDVHILKIGFKLAFSISMLLLGPFLYFTKFDNSFSIPAASTIMAYAFMALSLLSFIPAMKNNGYKGYYFFSICIMLTGIALGPLWTHCTYTISRMISKNPYRRRTGLIFGMVFISQNLASLLCDKLFTFVADYYQWKYYFLFLILPVLFVVCLNLSVRSKFYMVLYDGDTSENASELCEEERSDFTFCKNTIKLIQKPPVLLTCILIFLTKNLKYGMDEICSRYSPSISNSMETNTKLGGFIGVIVIGCYLDLYSISPKTYPTVVFKSLFLGCILQMCLFLIYDSTITRIVLFLAWMLITGSKYILTILIPIQMAKNHGTSKEVLLSVCNGYPALFETVLPSLLNAEIFNLYPLTCKYVLLTIQWVSTITFAYIENLIV